jgi:hypothetical protein
MAHALFNEPTSYGSDTLRLLNQAFDELWKDIAGNYASAQTIEDRRMRLALIILELANIGERDLDEIKTDALAIMRLRDRETRH